MQKLVLKPQNSLTFLRPGRVVKLQDSSDDTPPVVVSEWVAACLHTHACHCSA
jgi:hypothetical protein